jgi:nucleoid-associated protein YgaU
VRRYGCDRRRRAAARGLGAVLACGGLALCAGCETLSTSQREEVQAQTDMQRMEGNIVRLNDRVGALSASQEDIRRQMDGSRGSYDERIRQLEDKVAALERSLQASEQARQSDRKEIVDQLSTKISGIVGPSPQRSSARRETGVEHVVQPGQTLSAICAVYGVSVSAVVKANGLKDANSIRVGQKLFIPD